MKYLYFAMSILCILMIHIGVSFACQDQDILKSIFSKTVNDTSLLKEKVDRLQNLSFQMKEFLYSYHLFMQDSTKYKDNFIRTFPEDYDGIMRLVYEKIEVRKLTPEFMYSFKVLGENALLRNCIAAKKIIMVYVHSDGIVAELVSNYMIELFKNHLSLIIDHIYELSENDIQKIGYSFKMIESNDKQLIKEQLKEYRDSKNRNLNLLIKSIS